jgi:hypothetical protein
MLTKNYNSTGTYAGFPSRLFTNFNESGIMKRIAISTDESEKKLALTSTPEGIDKSKLN